MRIFKDVLQALNPRSHLAYLYIAQSQHYDQPFDQVLSRIKVEHCKNFLKMAGFRVGTLPFLRSFYDFRGPCSNKCRVSNRPKRQTSAENRAVRVAAMR